MKKGVIIGVSVSVLILIILIAFSFLIKNYTGQIKEGLEINSSVQNDKILKPYYWDHSNLTYSLNKKECGAYGTRRVEKAFEEITRASENKFLFKEANLSKNEKVDINISCSYIDNCYEKILDNPLIEGYYYEEEYEMLCPYDKGISSFEVESGKITSAKLEFVGLANFYEQNPSGSSLSGFSVGDCGYPVAEIRELLKILKGYSLGYDPRIRPAIYSYDYDSKDYSIMNNFQIFSGSDTYQVSSCSGTLKNIDSWIVNNLRNTPDNLGNNEAYFKECQYLPSLDRIEWCQLNASNYSKNEKGCEPITDSFKKDGCYQLVALNKKEYSVCGLIQDNGIKDSCYFNSASFTHSINPCLKITNITRKEWCYQNISVDLLNESNCEYIQDYDRKKWCYEAVAQEKKEDNICSKQGMGNTGICVALANNSINLCYSSTDSEFNQECVIRIAEKNNDPNLCYKIQKQDYYSKINRNIYCISNIAILTKNEFVCSYIKDIGDNKDARIQDYQDWCYYSVAYDKEETQVCSNIKDKPTKDSCYWDLAKIKKDPSVCSLIMDKTWVNYCIKSLDLFKNI
jgi:hypothetical protein